MWDHLRCRLDDDALVVDRLDLVAGRIGGDGDQVGYSVARIGEKRKGVGLKVTPLLREYMRELTAGESPGQAESPNRSLRIPDSSTISPTRCSRR